jgi:hypothetical protein
MSNSHVTNEALRLLADSRLRRACVMLWAMMLLSAAMIWRAVATDASWSAWFASGIMVGATFGAFGNLVAIVGHRRQMREAQDTTRQAATLLVDFVTDELHTRGDDYEAQLEPNGLITIHRRDRHEHRTRH